MTATVKGLAASGTTGRAGRARLTAGQTRTGVSVASQSRPRRLRMQRSRGKLVVSWLPGAVRVRDYAVTIKIGRHTVVLMTAPNRRRVAVAGLPRRHIAVRVVLRAAQLDGRLGPRVTLAGRR